MKIARILSRCGAGCVLAAGLGVIAASAANDTRPVVDPCSQGAPAAGEMCLAGPPGPESFLPRSPRPEPVDSGSPEDPVSTDFHWVEYDFATGLERVIVPPPHTSPGPDPFVPAYLGCLPDPCAEDLRAVLHNPDQRTQITKTTDWPYRAIGEFTMTWDNGRTYTGSGALISGNVVLTCAHNVHDKEEDGATNKWANSLAFAPGQTNVILGGEINENAQPYGSFKGVKAYTYVGWTAKRSTYFDIAVVVLDKPAGNKTGWFGYEVPRYNPGDKGRVTGYPGDRASGSMWTGKDLVRAPTVYNIRHEVDTFQGQSGSPIWYWKGGDNPTIFGVHTGRGRSTLANPNWGTNINEDFYLDIDAWKRAHPAPPPPPPPPARGAACLDGCGRDCNRNGVQDVDDILGGFSADSNGDAVPDECQQAVLNPADEVVFTSSPVGPLAAGRPVCFEATVRRAGVPLAGRTVWVTCAVGMISTGIADPDGHGAMHLTDSAGVARITMTPLFPGPGSMSAQVPGTALSDLAPFGTLPSLVGDFNTDCVVGLPDLVVFLGDFGGSVAPACGVPQTDIDLDGSVTTLDLVLMLAAFGTSCPSP